MTKEFSLLGLSIKFEGDGSALALIENLTSTTGNSSSTADIHIHAQFPRVCDINSSRFYAAASLGDLPGLTVSLLLERVRALLDDLYIFHGNSVVEQATGRPVLLVGHSGVGKTTLTRELARLDGFAVQAEDNLLVRSGLSELHPYPRAASLRVSGPEKHADLPPWPALGGRRTGKVIAPHDRYSHSVLSLRGAVVLLLTGEPLGSHPSIEPRTDTLSETFLLSCMPPLLSDELKSHFPKVEVRESTAYPSPLPLICFKEGVQGPQRRHLFELLASHGAMVISSFHGERPENIHRAPRPERPLLTTVRPFDALRQMMLHEIQFAAPDIPDRDVTQSIMQLARAFQTATFHNLVPGGAPVETIDAIIKKLDSNQP